MKEIFSRNVPGTTEVLQRATVGVAGCGGLGSTIAISLVRAGVGNLILLDFDVIELSNLNRQQFLLADVGKKKVDVLSDYLKAINPCINIEKHDSELKPENVKEIFGKADLLIEAFDRAENKKWLIESWCNSFPHKPVVCGNGLAGYGKTEDLKVIKIGNIYFCGDGKSDMKKGLCAPRIGIVANMEANAAIEILMEKGV